MKLRVYLSPEQENLYKQYVGTSRWIYNMCINLENYNILTLNENRSKNQTKLRHCFSSPETIEEMIKKLECNGLKNVKISL